MPALTANGMTLEYDRFGDPNAAPLLLVMGLGAQMIFWDEEFCEGLAARNRHVIRFDNRDCGQSTVLDDLGVPDMVALFTAVATGKPPVAPYLLSDMADDAAALLDGLGIASAHVVGASMGGARAARSIAALRRREPRGSSRRSWRRARVRKRSRSCARRRS